MTPLIFDALPKSIINKQYKETLLNLESSGRNHGEDHGSSEVKETREKRVVKNQAKAKPRQLDGQRPIVTPQGRAEHNPPNPPEEKSADEHAAPERS